eukprot:m.89185 g.89185  ORF g.89185 m.89185 type:complete len:458 (-) comp13646_c0_seq1:22-1395(-)
MLVIDWFSQLTTSVMGFFAFPEVDGHQQRMYVLIALVFFSTLGGYWLIRPMKMGVFALLVGIEHEPQAKLGTLAILVPLLMGYNKVYSMFENPKKLVFCVSLLYALAFFGIAICLKQHADDTTLMPRVEPSPASPGYYLGWFTYWTIESFGSVVVAMVWSVTAVVSSSTTARNVYPKLVISQQLGAVAGATLATFTETFGFPVFFALQGLNVLATSTVLHFALDIHERRTSFSRALDRDRKVARPQTGFLEGLRLICTRPYVLAVLVVSTFAAAVLTIMDFQMKMVAKETLTTGEELTMLLAHLGQATNITSLLLALFGTQKLIKRWGLRFCLLAYPLTVAPVLLFVALWPQLWVLCVGLVVVKSLGYALNGPAREMLYLRTSTDIQFKAKSWIDMFGTRGAKASGAAINNALRGSLTSLLHFGSLSSALFVAVWLVAATRLGRVYKEYEQHNRFVE